MQVRQKQKIDKLLGYFLIGLLWPVTRLFGLTLNRDHSLGKAPQKILFIKLMGLGSLVVATDAVAVIKKKYPNAKFILLTDNNLAAGIKPFGIFDEIYQTNTNHLWDSIIHVMRFLIKTWTWKDLWVVDLEVYSKLTTVFALMTLAENRFGFFLPLVSFRKYLNTHNIPFDQSAILEDNYFDMAKAITGQATVQYPVPEVRINESGRKFIVFNNTCSSLAVTRKLPDEILLEICNWTLEYTQYNIAFLGMSEDRAAIDLLIKNNQQLFLRSDRILNYAGGTNDFDTYYKFLKNKGVCLVTIDSGPLHIAKKLGLPTLSIWGPTNPQNYLKIYPEEIGRHLVYYLKKHCSPCVHRYEVLPCGGNNICIKEMEAKNIIDQLQQLLAHIAAPNSILRKV